MRIGLNLITSDHNMSFSLSDMSLTMFSMVYQAIINNFKSYLIFMSLMPFFWALMGCDGANDLSADEFTLLPDGSGMLVSEFAQPDKSTGFLSLVDFDTDQRHELYSSDTSNDLRARLAIWGDLDCVEPEQFSPQGFDLAQRPSGRWQLLVVNHGLSETVEMFELQKNSSERWDLLWRGCVETPNENTFIDVTTLREGFLLTRRLSRQEKFSRWVSDIFGKADDGLWRWRLRDGFQRISADNAKAFSQKTDSNG